MLGLFAGLDSTAYVTRANSDPQNITAKVGATGVAVSVTLTGIDLTDYGDLVLAIERPTRRGDVQVIEDASITVSGASNNVFTFQPDSTVLAYPADFIYSLREVSTGDVIVSGRLAVSYAALEDVP
jgi:hypothetical protein